MQDTDPAIDLAALSALAGRVIPASAEFNVPGADDPAIFAEILREVGPKLAALETLQRDLRAIGVAEIARAPLDALLSRLTTAHGAAFGLFAMATIQAYYRDDRVLASLGMEARPPFPKGYVVEDGDLTLLEPVRVRGPIWRRPP